MFRVLSGISAFVVFGFIVVLAVGYLAPVEYEGQISEFFIDRRAIIWQALVNVENIPKVKNDVERIEIISNDRGLIAWKEVLPMGKYRSYRTVEKKEPYKYTINMFESTSGLTGEWTFFISNSNNGTIVKVMEKSKNESVWLRGWQTILGRDTNLKNEMKILRVSLFRRLIDTP